VNLEASGNVRFLLLLGGENGRRLLLRRYCKKGFCLRTEFIVLWSGFFCFGRGRRSLIYLENHYSYSVYLD